MASSYAHMPKAHQHGKRRFTESNQKTLVDKQKNEVKLKKMIDTLEHQQSTAVNNIANHQQAMKMSWRRLEERRSASPLLTRQEKKREEAKDTRRGLLLQSNTKLYVNKTPEIYNVSGGAGLRPATADGRTQSLSGGSFIHKKLPHGGPPPTQLTRSSTSPYITSPFGFRRSIAIKNGQQVSRADYPSEGIQLKLTGPQELTQGMLSSSQPTLIKGSASAINDKETLLKASNLMDIKSSSSGPGGFKNFYSGKPRSQTQGTLPVSPLVNKQIEELILDDGNIEQDEDEVRASNSMPSLAEQFEQIKSCRYIRHSRHYHPEQASEDDY